MRLKNKLLIGAALGFLGLATAALSQNVTVPLIPTGGINPTADVIQVIRNGQPSTQSTYAYPAQITGTYGYYKSAPATGFNYSFAANVTRVAFNPSGTLAVGYAVLPTAPSDGQRACIFSTQIITALYVCATSTGAANCTTTGINNPLAGSLSANASVCYLYSKSNASWDRD